MSTYTKEGALLVADAERRVAAACAVVQSKMLAWQHAENAAVDADEIDDNTELDAAHDLLDQCQHKHAIARDELVRLESELATTRVNCAKTTCELEVADMTAGQVKLALASNIVAGTLTLQALDKPNCCGDCLGTLHTKTVCDEGEAVDVLGGHFLALLSVEKEDFIAKVVDKFVIEPSKYRLVVDAELRAAGKRLNLAQPGIDDTKCRYCLMVTSKSHTHYANCTLRFVARALLRASCTGKHPSIKDDTCHRRRQLTARLVAAKAFVAPRAPVVRTAVVRGKSPRTGQMPMKRPALRSERRDERLVAAEVRIVEGLRACRTSHLRVNALNIETQLQPNGLVMSRGCGVPLDAFLRECVEGTIDDEQLHVLAASVCVIADDDDDASVMEELSNALPPLDARAPIEIGGQDFIALGNAVAIVPQPVVFSDDEDDDDDDFEPSAKRARQTDPLERLVDEMRAMRETFVEEMRALRSVLEKPRGFAPNYSPMRASHF